MKYLSAAPPGRTHVWKTSPSTGAGGGTGGGGRARGGGERGAAGEERGAGGGEERGERGEQGEGAEGRGERGGGGVPERPHQVVTPIIGVERL